MKSTREGSAAQKAAPRHLKLVEKPAVDIYAKWYEEIRSRDWKSIHVIGDRREAVELLERRRGSWVK